MKVDTKMLSLETPINGQFWRVFDKEHIFFEYSEVRKKSLAICSWNVIGERTLEYSTLIAQTRLSAIGIVHDEGERHIIFILKHRF